MVRKRCVPNSRMIIGYPQIVVLTSERILFSVSIKKCGVCVMRGYDYRGGGVVMPLFAEGKGE